MRALNNVLTVVIRSFAAVAGLILAAIVTVLVVNVATRLVAGVNIHGMVDGIEHGLMVATFLAAPWVLMKNAHVSVDLVPRALGPVGRRRLSLLTDLFGAVLSLVLCWASAQALAISFARGAVTRGVLDIPEWLLLAAPAVGSALLAAEFLRRALSRHGGDLGLVGL